MQESEDEQSQEPQKIVWWTQEQPEEGHAQNDLNRHQGQTGLETWTRGLPHKSFVSRTNVTQWDMLSAVSLTQREVQGLRRARVSLCLLEDNSEGPEGISFELHHGQSLGVLNRDN